MEAREKIGLNILRQELGCLYKGQSYEELKKFNGLGGFYMKTCREEKIELKSDVLLKLLVIDSKILSKRTSKKSYTGDIFNRNIDELVSGSWEELRAIDDGKLLDKVQDKFQTL